MGKSKKSKELDVDFIGGQYPLTKSEEKKVSSLLKVKYSFAPISNPESFVLLLGSLPGDKSIGSNEYYNNSGNRFWKIISKITDCDLPLSYENKKSLLIKHKIGIWDVAHNAIRNGSLDNGIINEVPNDLESFILSHKKIRTIGFNGKKAEILYDKYFKRNPKIRYISLPSTSSANAKIPFEVICNLWMQILA